MKIVGYFLILIIVVLSLCIIFLNIFEAVKINIIIFDYSTEIGLSSLWHLLLGIIQILAMISFFLFRKDRELVKDNENNAKIKEKEKEINRLKAENEDCKNELNKYMRSSENEDIRKKGIIINLISSIGKLKPSESTSNELKNLYEDDTYISYKLEFIENQRSDDERIENGSSFTF